MAPEPANGTAQSVRVIGSNAPTISTFDFQSGNSISWIRVAPLSVTSGEFTIAWWSITTSVDYSGGSPRIFKFASSTSSYTMQAAISSNGYWCARAAPSACCAVINPLLCKKADRP